MTVAFLRRDPLTVHSSSKVIGVHFSYSQVIITAFTDRKASVPSHFKYEFFVSVKNNRSYIDAIRLLHSIPLNSMHNKDQHFEGLVW